MTETMPEEPSGPRAAFDEAYLRNDIKAAERALEDLTLALWVHSGAVADAACLLRVMRERENDPAHETDEV